MVLIRLHWAHIMCQISTSYLMRIIGHRYLVNTNAISSTSRRDWHTQLQIMNTLGKWVKFASHTGWALDQGGPWNNGQLENDPTNVTEEQELTNLTCTSLKAYRYWEFHTTGPNPSSNWDNLNYTWHDFKRQLPPLGNWGMLALVWLLKYSILAAWGASLSCQPIAGLLP